MGIAISTHDALVDAMLIACQGGDLLQSCHLHKSSVPLPMQMGQLMTEMVCLCHDTLHLFLQGWVLSTLSCSLQCFYLHSPSGYADSLQPIVCSDLLGKCSVSCRFRQTTCQIIPAH